MAWAWTETLAVSTEDRPKIPPVQSFKPPVGAKVREDPRLPHDASKPGGRNEADRWVKFAAAAFQQAGIRRGDADQLAFEDGLGNFDETPARVWTVPTRKGITRDRNLVHEEVTASQNKERNLIHCREYNRKGWTQQQLCRVVRGMDYTYHASQAKAQPTQDNRELVWAARQSENSKV
ncbi:PKAR, partial [Symbiodinium necroappetens]